jgi:DNA-directed RNA polymerase subunit L
MAKKATEMKVNVNVSDAFAKVMSNEKVFNAAKSAGADANKAKAAAKLDSYVTLIADVLVAGYDGKVSAAGVIAKPWKNSLKKALVEDGGVSERVYEKYVANIGKLIKWERKAFDKIVADNPADDLYGAVSMHLAKLDCESEAKIKKYIDNRADPKDAIEVAAEKIAKDYFKVWKDAPEKMSRLEELVKANLESYIKAESDRRAAVAETNENVDMMEDLKSKADAA